MNKPNGYMWMNIHGMQHRRGRPSGVYEFILERTESGVGLMRGAGPYTITIDQAKRDKWLNGDV